MQIHQRVKSVMDNHHQKIELFQWATISGISSLMYGIFIHNSRQKHVPTRVIQVPSVKSITHGLAEDSNLIQTLSERFVDDIICDNLFREFSEAPEFLLFNEGYEEILKTVFDLYILPNISRYVPQALINKFGLNNPDQQLFRESNEIDLLDENIPDDYISYIVHETVLQLLLLIPSMKKSIKLPELNCDIYMGENDILTVGVNNGLCPILFDHEIILDRDTSKILEYSTSTIIRPFDVIIGGNECYEGSLCINSAPFNEISLTTLEGVSKEEP